MSFPVIFIMGQTGVGKSQFINTAVGRDVVEVGYDLESKTTEPRSNLCICDGESVYLVDTPGFDDTYDENDIATLTRIVDWFNNSGRTSSTITRSRFCGILYLIEAKQKKFPMLRDLKGVNQCFLVVATKGKRKKKDVAVDCLFYDDQDSAWNAIRAVLEKKRQVENIPVRLFFQRLGELVAKSPKPPSKPPPNPSKKFSWKRFFGLG